MQFKAPTSSLKTITNNLTRADEYLQESSNQVGEKWVSNDYSYLCKGP
jgi:hypothetical protein